MVKIIPRCRSIIIRINIVDNDNKSKIFTSIKKKFNFIYVNYNKFKI